MSRAIQARDDSRAAARRSEPVDDSRSTSRVLRPFAAPGGLAPRRPRGDDSGWREPGPDTPAGLDPLSRLLVRVGRRLVVVSLAEVDWIEAEGNYVRLHREAGSHRYRRTLEALASRLDGHRFVRTHRSAMVNVDRVRELQPTGSGGYDIVLGDGTRLPLSRSYKKRVFAVLGKE